MITLRKARNLAKMVSKHPLPSESGLRNWSSLGCIQSPVSFDSKGRGGRIGLYDESLPIQIAVVSEIKNEFSLKSISEVADMLIPKLSSLDISYRSPDLFQSFKKKLINEIINKMNQKEYENLNIKNIKKMLILEEENFIQLKKMQRSITIAKKYIEIWRKKAIELDDIFQISRKRKVE